jgi:hypothetical protein
LWLSICQSLGTVDPRVSGLAINHPYDPRKRELRTEVRHTLQTLGWIAFGIDAVGLLALLGWALTASTRDGEIAYALVFLLIAGVWLGMGGVGLTISSRRASSLGLWCSALFLAVPPALMLALRILNSL